MCRAQFTIEDMCRDQWNWAKNNPWGYGKDPQLAEGAAAAGNAPAAPAPAAKEGEEEPKKELKHNVSLVSVGSLSET